MPTAHRNFDEPPIRSSSGGITLPLPAEFRCLGGSAFEAVGLARLSLQSVTIQNRRPAGGSQGREERDGPGTNFP